MGDVWLWGNCWLKHQVTRKDQTWCHCHHCHNQYNDHCYNHHKIIAKIFIMIIATLQAVLSSNKHRRSKGWVAGREQCDHQSLTTEVPFHHPALYLAVCMTLLSQNPLTVSTTQQSTTYWTTTQSTTSTTTTTTTTTSTTTKPPVMLYNDHIVVSTDPDALAIYGSILSGTWEIPQGQEKKIFLCLYVEIIKVQHNHHRGRHGHGQQQRNHHQVKQ